VVVLNGGRGVCDMWLGVIRPWIGGDVD